jgi:hypothetical protein
VGEHIAHRPLTDGVGTQKDRRGHRVEHRGEAVSPGLEPVQEFGFSYPFGCARYDLQPSGLPAP